MGISQLISTLEPFAVHQPFDQPVIIDGPSFAYHILYVCSKDDNSHPSYSLLGEAAVAWLDQLTSRGIRIEAIYFDGHLPLAKRPVRMVRMIKNFNTLNTFRDRNPSYCPLSYISPTRTAVPEFFVPFAASCKKALNPPFHVPAIIEALKESLRYHSLVHIVPGEADGYCANQARQMGGHVLTSDSDLLVHDLGQGSVTFFKDIYFDGESKLACKTFPTNEISERLGMPGSLCRFAYEKKRDTHISLHRILLGCLQPVKDKEDFEAFCQEYLDHEESPLPVSSKGNRLSVECLDPRQSELVLQLGRSNENLDTDFEDKIFLPILIEDPLRGSAWEQSTSIRGLAYTITRWVIPGSSSHVQEFRRVNTPLQKGRKVSMLNKTDAKEASRCLAVLMTHLHERIGDDTQLRWLIFCIVLDIRDCYEQDKPSIVLEIIRESITSPPERSAYVPWKIVHFMAHIHASYYSLRMLKQMLSLAPQQETEETMTDLQGLLSSLPPLSSCPDFSTILEFLRNVKQERIVKTLSQFVEIFPDPPTQASQTTKKKKKTTKTKQGNSKELKPPSSRRMSRPTSRNPFDVLNDES